MSIFCVWVLFRLHCQVLSSTDNVTLLKAIVLNNCTIGMHCMLGIELNDVKKKTLMNHIDTLLFVPGKKSFFLKIKK